MTRWLGRSLAAGIVAMAVTLSPAFTAVAQARVEIQPYHWESGDAVGLYCGDKSDNYVRSWQSILWSAGLLSTIDGLAGKLTYNATRTWQSQHGLAVDGCAGVHSWHTAQYGSYVYCEPHYGCETIRYLTPTGDNGDIVTYTYQASASAKRVGYIEDYYDDWTHNAAIFQAWYVNNYGTYYCVSIYSVPAPNCEYRA